jgi:hypothetical protein
LKQFETNGSVNNPGNCRLNERLYAMILLAGAFFYNKHIQSVVLHHWLQPKRVDQDQCADHQSAPGNIGFLLLHIGDSILGSG